MKKLVLIFVVGATLVWFGASFVKKQMAGDKAPGSKRPQGNIVVAVETGNVIKGNMYDEGVFSGSIEAESKFQVAPKIAGRLKKLNVDIGDSIKSGDIVAELDDEELALAVEQAESALEIAKANYIESQALLKISENELKRVETMRKQKIASEVEVEKANADYKTRSAKNLVNKSQLRQSETSLAQAKLKLAYSKIDASWTAGSNSRYIAERFLNEGAMISANTPIVSVIDIETLTAVIDVVERDYFKITKGMDALIIPDAMNGKAFEGKVSRIAPMLDSVSRQGRIELTLDNALHYLKPGMFITAKIIYGTHLDTTIVPLEALVIRNNEEGIFIVDEKEKVGRFVPVVSGYRNTTQVEIISPELSGRVVTLGQHLLEDGMAIRIPADEKKESNGSEPKK